MRFGGKKQLFEKNTREINGKKMSKELKIDFFWTDD